jgi:hypothetical protein
MMPQLPMADDKKQKTLFLDDAAAPPAAPPTSGQSTMMLDSSQAAPPAQRQMVVPTMMKEPPRQQLPPMQRPKPPSTVGRWIAGPIIAIVVAAGTVAVAGMVMPRHKKAIVKPQGKLAVRTTPPGASILVDGKRFPRFTPATIDADVGATLKLTFAMDGYQTQESEVYVGEGEHTFSVALKPAAPPPAAPAPAPAPEPPKHEHHTAKAKEPVGDGTITVLVRPWAIVFVDKQRLKQTPVQGYKLPAGKHVIELVNESKNRREKIDLNLKPGEEQEIHRDWDK